MSPEGGGCCCAYTRARGHRMGMQHFFNVFIILFVPGPEARAGPHPSELPQELPGAVADVGGRQGQVGLGGGQGGGGVLRGGPSSVRPPLQRERGRPRRGRDGRQRRRGLRGGRRRDRKRKKRRICGGTKSRRRMKRGKLFFTLLLSLFLLLLLPFLFLPPNSSRLGRD